MSGFKYITFLNPLFLFSTCCSFLAFFVFSILSHILTFIKVIHSLTILYFLFFCDSNKNYKKNILFLYFLYLGLVNYLFYSKIIIITISVPNFGRICIIFLYYYNTPTIKNTETSNLTTKQVLPFLRAHQLAITVPSNLAYLI